MTPNNLLRSLNPIASILKEVGARELIDLIDIYSDEDLLREVTEHHTCNKIMQKRFLKAAYLTSLFDGVSSSFIVNSASVMSISATTGKQCILPYTFSQDFIAQLVEYSQKIKCDYCR